MNSCKTIKNPELSPPQKAHTHFTYNLGVVGYRWPHEFRVKRITGLLLPSCFIPQDIKRPENSVHYVSLLLFYCRFSPSWLITRFLGFQLLTDSMCLFRELTPPFCSVHRLSRNSVENLMDCQI